uniref:Orf39 n=1 Tax=Coccophora langsdorfii TaxID=74099 RepID=A0A1L2F1H0_9PHAE|nr:orf39 [Coccophora langsdorfii]ANS72183.1 orf39 [Coccophora langsdorfii]
MKISFLQLLFIFGVGLLFFADLPKLAKSIREKIKKSNS